MRDREPVKLVQIAIPIICEIIAVTLFIAAGATWIIIAATRVPV